MTPEAITAAMREMTEEQQERVRHRYSNEYKPPLHIKTTFIFESAENLDALVVYSPPPPEGCKIAIRNMVHNPLDRYDYNKRNRWIVREVIGIVLPCDNDYSQLLNEHRLEYEVYLIRDENVETY